MGKNKARHLLHGILDLLPVFVIPLLALAVRSDNNFTPIEVQQNVSKLVDFNQKGKIQFGSGFGGITKTDYSSYMHFEGTITSIPTGNRIYGNSIGGVFGHIFLIDFRISGTTTNTSGTYPFIADGYIGNQCNITTGHLQYRSNGNQNNLISCLYCGVLGDTISIDVAYEYFDLTQMFGVGNEPTIAEFNQWFTDTYYPYTDSEKVLIENYDTITYSEQDVGSQMVYTLYNTVDKYFNMGNVFGMNDVYNWFITNIFNGNSSMSVYIVWNIVLYEFVMDLLFLLYGLFMFFIDMCKRLMEKPLNSIK